MIYFLIRNLSNIGLFGVKPSDDSYAVFHCAFVLASIRPREVGNCPQGLAYFKMLAESHVIVKSQGLYGIRYFLQGLNHRSFHFLGVFARQFSQTGLQRCSISHDQ